MDKCDPKKTFKKFDVVISYQVFKERLVAGIKPAYSSLSIWWDASYLPLLGDAQAKSAEMLSDFWELDGLKKNLNLQTRH